MEYCSLVRWNLSKAFCLIKSAPLTDCLQPLFTQMLHHLLSSITVFMLTPLLILLTACLPSSCGLTTQDFLLPITSILSNSLMQELTSTPSHLFLLLVNSAFVFPTSYDLILFKREVSRHLSWLWDNSIDLSGDWHLVSFLFSLFLLPLAYSSLLPKRKNST